MSTSIETQHAQVRKNHGVMFHVLSKAGKMEKQLSMLSYCRVSNF